MKYLNLSSQFAFAIRGNGHKVDHALALKNKNMIVKELWQKRALYIGRLGDMHAL